MALPVIVQDVLNIIKDATPLPDFKVRTDVKAWSAKLAPDVVDLAYDFGGFDKAAKKLAKISTRTWATAAKKLGWNPAALIDVVNAITALLAALAKLLG